MNTTSLPYFDLSDIKLEERIGQGNSPVYQATMADKTIAVKKMDCGQNEIPHEVQVQRDLPPNPNVLKLLGITHSEDGFTIYVCTELANTSLYRYLHEEKKQPSLQQSTKWAMQIASGMQHLHKYGLAHRDLKSPNVLLFEREDIAKVCDFGCARPLDHTTMLSGNTGTYRWMPPEFNDEATTMINQRCDIFSYGMILYEIFAHNIPFSHIKEDVDVPQSIRNGERPSLPQELPIYMKVLIQFCWEHKPHDRPNFEKILQVGSPYLHFSYNTTMRTGIKYYKSSMFHFKEC